MNRNEALIQLLAKSGKSQAEVARLSGVNTTQIQNWKNHKNNIRPDSLEKIADAIGYKIIYNTFEDVDITKDSEWQDIGRLPAEQGLLPVVGLAEAGPGISSIDDYTSGDADLFVSKPYKMNDPNAFGVLVQGKSMEPVYRHNQVVICSPNLETKNGDRAVIGLNSGERCIGEVYFKKDTLEIKKYNHSDISIPLDNVQFVYKICWVKE